MNDLSWKSKKIFQKSGIYEVKMTAENVNLYVLGGDKLDVGSVNRRMDRW